MLIRRAVKEDTEQVYSMACEFVYSHPTLSKIGIGREEVEFLLDASFSSPSCLFFVAEEHGKLEGMICFIASPHLFNRSLMMAEEIVFWVNPESRNKKISDSLLSSVEEGLKALGVKLAGMKFLTDPSFNPNLVERFFKRKGYNRTEIAVIKEL